MASAAASYEDDVEENKYKQLILRPWPSTEISESTFTPKKLLLAKELLNSILKVDASKSKTFHYSVVRSIPDYKDVIPNPICLEEVQKKLQTDMYSTVEMFLRDLRRVFANCVRYWGPMGEETITAEALHLLKLCEEKLTPNLSTWRLCKHWMKCTRVLFGLLAKGETSTFIFLRPISFYYDGIVPEDYIPTVLYMSDIGSLTSSLFEGDIASPQGFVRECVRIFHNCQIYTEYEDYRRCAATMLKELKNLVAVELPKCLSEVKDDRWHKRRKKQKLQAAEDSVTMTVSKRVSGGGSGGGGGGGVKQQQQKCRSIDSPVQDLNGKISTTSLLHPDELSSKDVPLNITTSQRPTASCSNNLLEAMKEELDTSVVKAFISQAREACGVIFDKLRKVTIKINGQNYTTDPFFAPVDESIVSDYRQHVPSPMDLGQAQALLNKGSLHSVAKVFRTIRKVFQNAMQYNAPKKGKFGNATIHELASELLHEAHKLEEKTLRSIRGSYKTIFMERGNAGGGRKDHKQQLSTVYILCIPEKCPNVSVELLDRLELKEKLDGLLKVKHGGKRRSSRFPPPKPVKPLTSRTPTAEDDKGSNGNEYQPKLNSMNTTAAASRRNSTKNATFTKQPSVRRITLKLSSPAPSADISSTPSVGIGTGTPVHKSSLPTEVSRTTGIYNSVSSAAAVHLGTGSTESADVLTTTTVPSHHLPSSRPWTATHLFRLPKRLDRQHEKWELNCDKVLKRLMRHEFVDPKKSTLYLHIPACNVLPSADSYLDVIESPMDLGSIQKALEQGQIHDAQSFVDLTLLVFNNAIRFNMGSDIPDAIHLVDACSFLGRVFTWMCLETLELRDDDHELSDGRKRTEENKSLSSEAATGTATPLVSSCPLTMGFCKHQRLSRLKGLEELHVPRDGDDKEAFQLIKRLCTYQNSKYMKWFSDPVDVALIPDYREHVPNPIDISTIENKLTTHGYLKYGEIVSDLRRIFSNATRYNERLRAVDKNSNLICQAVEQMQPVLERLLCERFSIDVLERAGREKVLSNKRKRHDEENRRLVEARRKVNEDPQKLLKAHLPEEEESIGEVSGLNTPKTVPLMKRRDLGRRKEQRTRELELMDQQRADRLRRVVTKNVRRLCREHPNMCRMERPGVPSTAMKVVDVSSNAAEPLRNKIATEDVDDSARGYKNQQCSAPPLGNVVNEEKKWQPMKLREKKRPVSLLSSVFNDFEAEEEEEEVEVKQQQQPLHNNTQDPVEAAAAQAEDTAAAAIEQIPFLPDDGIRRQSFHIESLDRCDAIFEEIRFFFPRRPDRHSAFESINLVAEGLLLKPCRGIQVLLHSGQNHSVRSFGEDEQWNDIEVLQRVRWTVRNLRTAGPEEDCALLCHPHPITTSKVDARVSAVLQSNDVDDDIYLPVLGGCLVWTAVPSLGPPNHNEFCFLSRNGAIGNVRMSSNTFTLLHATIPRTE